MPVLARRQHRLRVVHILPVVAFRDLSDHAGSGVTAWGICEGGTGGMRGLQDARPLKAEEPV